ncbi:MAG: RNA polymerase sigma factor [Oscillospiraceae bacterium]|nr:RNA polymerase sigma factor [Oscillospiraceae bacterium]
MSAERALINRVLSGDTEAFAPLVEEHQRMVYNLALRMLRNPQNAQDAAQDAFLRAFRSLSKFRGESSFSVWLYRLTSNVCLDALRKSKRAGKVVSLYSDDDDDDGRMLDLPDDSPLPEESAERRENIECVRAAMKILSPEHREILMLREVDGLNYAEIAEQLNINEGTVKSRINRAKLALRRELEKSGNFSPFDSSNKTEGGMNT